jgi:acylaminoacyl-peptidase
MSRFASLFLVSLLLPAALPAQSNRFTPQDIFQLEFAADPQISPDGQWIAYVRQFADLMSDKRYSNIWLIRADGTDHRPLTTGKYNDGSPRWSPDGKRLAYVSNRENQIPQVYVRWMETGQTAAITNLTEPPAGISWSPNGQWIAFTKLVPEKPFTVGELPPAPAGAHWAPPPKYTNKLIFRFDGVGELPSGYTHLFVVPAEGGTARQLSTGSFHHGGAGFGGSLLSWTPDGESILLAANRKPDYELHFADSEIFEFNVKTGAMKQLTDRRGPDGDAVVSPDGKLIAYTGYDERFQGYQNTLLYVMNRDGSGSHVVSSKLDNSVQSLTWAPDGRGIYAMFDEKGTSKLAIFGLDGSYKVVAQDIGTGGMAYGGGSYSVARDGSFALTVSLPNIPGDVAVGRPGVPQKTITALNEDLFAGKELGQVEEAWWPSSKDQRKIQGWIIKPPGFDPSKKYPMILEIHGGPFANYGPRFDAEKQAMAGMGFVVLYTNPRGSTSYGEEFGNLIHHAYPGDDFYDLNSGVDYVIGKGYVDDKNLFVTGGSGGGVLTAWMIGNTQRFKAALAFYPVINWESFTLTADMAPMAASNWFPGLPWDQRENYWKRSLLSVVKNVTTPTLIMTGEEDFRTPMSESEQYYKALKLQGKEAVLVRVPGEPHGIMVRPSHAMSKMTTLKGWFQQHQAQTP